VVRSCFIKNAHNLASLRSAQFKKISPLRYIISNSLHVLLPPAYPTLLPAKFFFYKVNLAPSLLRKINSSINKVALENSGSPSIFAVNEFLQANLSDFERNFSESQQYKELQLLKRNEDVKKGVVDVDDIQDRVDNGEKVGKRARQKLKSAQRSFARVSNAEGGGGGDKVVAKKKTEGEKRLEFKAFQGKLGEKRVEEHLRGGHEKEADEAGRSVMLDALNDGKGRVEARRLYESERREIMRGYGYDGFEEEDVVEVEEEDVAEEEFTMADMKKKKTKEISIAEQTHLNKKKKKNNSAGLQAKRASLDEDSSDEDSSDESREIATDGYIHYQKLN